MSEKTKNSRTFLKFTGLGVQLGLSIYLGNMLGKWLDTQYPNDAGWWEKGVTMFVIFGSIFSIIRQVNKITQDQE